MVFLLFMLLGLFSSLAAMEPEIKGLGEEDELADIFWLQASDGAKIAISRSNALHSTVLKDFIDSAPADGNSEQNPFPIINFPRDTVSLLKRMFNSQTLGQDIQALSPDQFYSLYRLAWYLGVEFLIHPLSQTIADICIKDPDILKKLTGDINGQLLIGVNEKNFNKLFELHSWLSPLQLNSKIVHMSMAQVQEIIKSRTVIRNPRYPDEVIERGRRQGSGDKFGLCVASWSSDGKMIVGHSDGDFLRLYKFEPDAPYGALIQDLAPAKYFFTRGSAWSHDDKFIASLTGSVSYLGPDLTGSKAYLGFEGFLTRNHVALYRRTAGDEVRWQLDRGFSFEHAYDFDRVILFDFNTQDTILKTLLTTNTRPRENFIRVLDLSVVFLKPEMLSMNQMLLLLVLEELNKTDMGKKRIQGSLSAIRNALQSYTPPEARQALAERYGLGAIQIPAYSADDILRDFPAQRVLPQVAAAEVKAAQAGVVDDVSRELALLHSSLTALAAS